MMEFPEEAPDSGVTNSSEKLTLEEKIESKNWKFRVDGYEQLRTEIPLSKDNKDFLKSCGTFINKITAESNPNALDVALDISILFFELCEKALDFCDLDKIFGNVVDKTFGARQSTLQRGKALILKIIETSDPNQLTILLLSKLNDKRPKVPGVCLDLLNEGFILFGGYNFPVKEILKAIPNVFNSSNSSARESAMSLLVELHRWIGQAPLQSLLETLRPAQQSDFEKLVASKNTDSNPIPTLGLRKDRLSGELARRAEKPMQVDARELVDEVDLSKKLKGTEFSTLVVSDKWADQVQGLDILIQAVGPTPKIKYSPAVHDVLASVNELLKNGHVQVQIKCLRVLSLFADGTRSKIQAEMRNIIGTVLLRSKEKKIVSEVAEAAILIFQHCVNFDFLVEDVTEILNNKKSPPHAKLCLSQVIESLVEKSLLTNQDTLKVIFQSFVGNTDDSDPKVREISIKCLQTMKDHFEKTEGKSPLASFLNALQISNPKLFKKLGSQVVPETEKKSEETDLRKSAATNPVSKQPAPSALAVTMKPSGKPVGSEVSKAPAKPASQLKSSDAVQKKSSKTDTADDDVVEDSSLSVEDALANLSAVDGLSWDALYSKLQSQKWQDKVEAFASFQDRASLLIDLFEAFHVVCISQGIWKSSNVNVVKGAIDLYAGVFAIYTSNPPKGLIAALISSTFEKLADKKLQKPIESLFEVFLQKSDPKFVFKRLGTLLANAKSPLVHQNLLAWMKVALSNLRNSQIPILIISQICVKEMENKSGAIRTGAIEVLCLLYSRIGPPFSSCVFTKDLNPQLKSILEQEFAKVEVNIPQETVAGEADDNLDIPRKDINELVEKGVVNDLTCLDGKDSWQVRKAAMEKILDACNTSGHYIEFNKTSVEILKQLKQRLSDTQSNLKVLAIQTISHLLASFSAEKALKALKPFVQSILLGLTDNKKPMRDATVSGLDIITKLNGETLNHSIFMCIALSATEILNGSIGRLELLTWLNLYAQHFSGDCGELAIPLLNSLQDKTSGVRLEAEALYISLYSRKLISKVAFEKATRDLSPATKRAIQNVLDRISASLQHGKETSEDLKQTIRPKEITKEIPSEFTSTVTEMHHEDVSESHHVPEKSDRRVDWQKWPVPPLQPSLYDFSVLKNKWKTEFPTAFLTVILESTELSEHLVSNIFASYSSKELLVQSDFFFRWVSYQLTLVQEMGKMKSILSFLHHFFWKCSELNPKFEGEELFLFLPHCVTKIPYLDKVELRSFEELIADITAVFEPTLVVKILSAVWAKAEVSSRIAGWNSLEKILQSHAGKLILPPSLIESLRKDYLSPEEKKKCEKILSLIENDPAPQNVSGFGDALKSLLKPKSSGLKPDIAKKPLFSWLLEDLTIAAQSISQIPTSKCRDIADITRLILEDRSISESMNVNTHLKDFFEVAAKLFQQCSRIEVSVIYSCLALVNFYSQFSPELMDELPYQTINSVVASLLNCLNMFGEQHLTTAGTLWRAINITLLQFVLSANSIWSLTVLLEMMNRDFQYHVSLRLGLAVLDKERKTRTPFEGSDDMISEMLLRLNELLSKQNQNFVSNAKFSKMIYGTILTTLSEDRISRLNLNGSLSYEYLAHSASLNVANQENVGENVVKIINEITFSKEKRSSISKLYSYQKDHPDVDVNDYLSKLSTPFQKYVYDMFAKLKEEEENQKIHEHRTPFKYQNESPDESDIQTNEALRIIENLKSRPTSYRQLNETPMAPPPPIVPESPFSRRNDKIRDSLSTLSKSLDLPTSFSEGPKTPFTESLEERLSRLKNLK